ncbi:MAG: NAD(P)H-dependent glycerol-3-phosphate dehydrogenase [Candidatus Hydrogenedentota bacterium]
MNEKIVILGTGGWGTALAIAWHRAEKNVMLWARTPERAAELRSARENRRLLPGVGIPDDLRIESDPGAALDNASAVVCAVPSKHMRGTIRTLAPFIARNAVVISAAKGLEFREGKPYRMTQVMASELGDTGADRVATISGPSHAEEVGRGLPTTLVVAGASRGLLRDVLSTRTLRLYTSDDLVGVELGGTLKNPIAIAAGIAKGLGAGDNALGALITRGVAEITRFGVAAGADEKTFAGLSGIGDLITTCVSAHSRNVRVGCELARGRKIEEILAELGMVAEGVETSRIVDRWAKSVGIETPITSAVVRVLFEGADPRRELEGLMARALKDEFRG